MSQRVLDRTNRTLRTMLAQHTAEGRSPSLQAITTIYSTLLTNTAGSDTWLLFTQVASLPLTVERLVPSCIVDDGYHAFGGKWVDGPCDNAPTCNHRNKPVTTTVQLDSPADMVHEGRILQRQQVAGWWGKQLQDAIATR